MNESLEAALPRLLAIDKTFEALDDRVSGVSDIIGLPTDWEKRAPDCAALTPDAKIHIRPRAEWVLRWILEKLQSDRDYGAQARANAAAWRLLEWMVHLAPITMGTRSLENANFLKILEKSLKEAFADEKALEAYSTRFVEPGTDMKAATTDDDLHKAANRSPGGPKKHKRPFPSPEPKPKMDDDELEQLFDAIVGAVKTLTTKTSSSDVDHIGAVLTSLVLQTDTAHVVRIMKFWFIALKQTLQFRTFTAKGPDPKGLSLDCLHKIWSLRKDASDDHEEKCSKLFSAECLLPALDLYHTIQSKYGVRRAIPSVVDNGAMQILQGFFKKHLLAPARAAYFADVSPPNPALEADYFTKCLVPLDAKLEQAANLYAGSPSTCHLDEQFQPFFQAVPFLMEMIIECSPLHTPKSEMTERPWIQAAFSALMNCAGCDSAARETSKPRSLVVALRDTLFNLAQSGIVIDSQLLKDIYWFHCGIEFPRLEERVVQWPLIAGLVKLESAIFLPIRWNLMHKYRPADLSEGLLDLISSIPVKDLNATRAVDLSDEVKTRHNMDALFTSDSSTGQQEALRSILQRSIIIPVMSAFARKRELVVFIHKWHGQLSSRATLRHHTVEDEPSIWEGRELSMAISEELKESLAPAQVSQVFADMKAHVEKWADIVSDQSGDPLASHENISVYRKSCAASLILDRLLDSSLSEDVVETLKPHLEQLLEMFIKLIQNPLYRHSSDLALSWDLIRKFFLAVWPIKLHGSYDLQRGFLASNVAQRAFQDVAITRGSKDQQDTTSGSRAAALVFLFHLCYHFQAMPAWADTIRQYMRDATTFFSTSHLEPSDYNKTLESVSFCLPGLLRLVDTDIRTQLFSHVFGEDFDASAADVRESRQALTESILSGDDEGTTAALCAVLLPLFAGGKGDSSEAIRCFLQAPPTALPRKERACVMDIAVDNLINSSWNDTGILLSLVAHLMQAPNMKAKLVSDTTFLCKIGENVSRIAAGLGKSMKTGETKKQPYQSLVVQTYQKVAQLSMSHVFNQPDQPQNARFIHQLVDYVTRDFDNGMAAFHMFPLLKAIMISQKEERVLSWSRYLDIVNTHYMDSQFEDWLAMVDEIPLDVFNNLATTETSLVKARIAEHFSHIPDVELIGASRVPLSSHSDIDIAFDEDSLNQSVQGWWYMIHKMWTKLYGRDDSEHFFTLSLRLLQNDSSPQKFHTVLASIRDFVFPLDTKAKLDLIGSSTSETDQRYHLQRLRILPVIISTLEDEHNNDPGEKQQLLQILPKLCELLVLSPKTAAFNALLDSMEAILRDKSTLTSQFSIECVLASVVTLLSPSSPSLPSNHAPAIYDRLCGVIRLILMEHRSRLGGRFHLLVPVLQGLLSALFIPHPGRSGSRPSWLRYQQTPNHSTTWASSSGAPQLPSPYLTPLNATHLSSLLNTLCNPLPGSLSKSMRARAATKLKDPLRSARIYVGQHITSLLSFFCRCQLNGRLDPSVREKLMPGLWECVDVASLDMDGLRAMYMSMDAAHRAIWKALWDEWGTGVGKEKKVRREMGGGIGK